MGFRRKIFNAVFGWHAKGGRQDPVREEAEKKLLELPYEELNILSHDGLKLYGMLFVNEGSDRFVILNHGYNSYGMKDHSNTALRYYEEGYTVLMPDNRGAGKSEGDFQGFGIFESRDNLLWFDYLKNRFGSGNSDSNSDSEMKVIIHGCSMGSGIVCLMAAMDLPKEIKCIISDCGFSKIGDEFSCYMQKHYLLKFRLAVSFVLNTFEKYSGESLKKNTPLDAVSRAKVPMLFIHGTADNLIPWEQSKLLYEACSSEKEFITVEGAGHIQSSTVDPERYFNTVFEFIGKHID